MDEVTTSAEKNGHNEDSSVDQPDLTNSPDVLMPFPSVEGDYVESGTEEDEVKKLPAAEKQSSKSPKSQINSPANDASSAQSIKVEKEILRLQNVLDGTSPEAAQRLLRENWRFFMFEKSNAYHVSFLLRAGLKNSNLAVLERVLKDNTIFKESLQICVSTKPGVIKKVLQAATSAQLMNHVSHVTIANIVDEYVRTATGRQLVNVLSKHSRLGFAEDDIMDEADESVAPNNSHELLDLLPDIMRHEVVEAEAPHSHLASPSRDPLLAEPERNAAASTSMQLSVARLKQQQYSQKARQKPGYVAKLSCPSCNARFTTFSGYDYHLSKLVCTKASKPENGWKWNCDNCVQGFTTKQGMDYHLIKKVCLGSDIVPATPPLSQSQSQPEGEVDSRPPLPAQEQSLATPALQQLMGPQPPPNGSRLPYVPPHQPLPSAPVNQTFQAFPSTQPTQALPGQQFVHPPGPPFQVPGQHQTRPQSTLPPRPPVQAPGQNQTRLQNTLPPKPPVLPPTQNQSRPQIILPPRPPLHTPTASTPASGHEQAPLSSVRQTPSDLPPEKLARLEKTLEDIDVKYDQDVSGIPSTFSAAERQARILSLKNITSSKKSQVRKSFGVTLRMREVDKAARLSMSQLQNARPRIEAFRAPGSGPGSSQASPAETPTGSLTPVINVESAPVNTSPPIGTSSQNGTPAFPTSQHRPSPQYGQHIPLPLTMSSGSRESHQPPTAGLGVMRFEPSYPNPHPIPYQGPYGPPNLKKRPHESAEHERRPGAGPPAFFANNVPNYNPNVGSHLPNLPSSGLALSEAIAADAAATKVPISVGHMYWASMQPKTHVSPYCRRLSIPGADMHPKTHVSPYDRRLSIGGRDMNGHARPGGGSGNANANANANGSTEKKAAFTNTPHDIISIGSSSESEPDEPVTKSSSTGSTAAAAKKVAHAEAENAKKGGKSDAAEGEPPSDSGGGEVRAPEEMVSANEA